MRNRLPWLLAFGLVACEGREAPAPRPSSVVGAPVPPSEVQLLGVVAESFHADRLVSRARAAELRVDRKKGELRAAEVEIERFDADTQTSRGRLRAARASGQLTRRDLYLEGGVLVRDVEGRSAETEAAQYLQAAQRLDMPGPVRVWGDNFEATGAGARYSLDTERLEVAPPVRAQVRPSP